MRKLFVLFAAAAALTTAACNTVEGVGEDTQAAGAAVSGAARDAGN
jgi:predicted small secreted protein